MRKNTNISKSETNPNDILISSFETADGRAAVELHLSGVAEMRMTPMAALQLASRLAVAAVAGSVFRIETEAVGGPLDGAVLGEFVRQILGRQLGKQTPETA